MRYKMGIPPPLPHSPTLGRQKVYSSSHLLFFFFFFLQSGNFLHPPSVWLKLQAPVLKVPQNFVSPPPAHIVSFISWLKRFPPSPSLFVGVKRHLPPLPFLSPLPVTKDEPKAWSQGFSLSPLCSPNYGIIYYNLLKQ